LEGTGFGASMSFTEGPRFTERDSYANFLLSGDCCFKAEAILSGLASLDKASVSV